MGQQAALAVGGIDTFQKGLFVVSGCLVQEGTEDRVIAHNLKNFAGHGGREINKLTVSTFAHLLCVPGKHKIPESRPDWPIAPKIWTSSPRITSLRVDAGAKETPGTIEQFSAPGAGMSEETRSSCRTGQVA